ncbi:MAG: nucleotidyltransferase family protein [Candidatus Acidiferrum sp.]|jgi:hypothetical protein
MAPSGSAGAQWAALTALASPALNPQALTNSFAKIDWPGLLALAEEHGVTQLLAVSSLRLPPEIVPRAIREQLAELQRTQAFFTLRMSAELFRLADRFAAARIAMLVVKGPALAMQAYGDAAMRNYGDLDLLVRDCDIARATQLMMDAGYQAHIPLSAISANKIPGQYMFRQAEAKLLVEIHNDRTMRYYPRALPIEEIFARHVSVASDGREIPAPCAEDHLVMICVHGAKHFWGRLMWIADVAALIGRQRELNWELAGRSARTVGADTMLHGGLLLAARVLKTPLPGTVLAGSEADAAAQRMLEQVVEWLPGAGAISPGLLQRALYRTRMRGGGVAGARYLWRLLFSATEEDWDANAEESHAFLAAVKRPFRLARKHRSGGQG